MKLFLVVLFLWVHQAVAQIPYNATTIVIKTGVQDSEACQKLMDLFRRDGWRLDHQHLKGFVTLYKPTINDWRLRLLTSVGDGKVIFQGESATESINHEPVVYKEPAGKMAKVHFDQMNKVALQLADLMPGSVVKYTTLAE